MKMLIGLTGRTGSGKTSAAHVFERLGAYIVNVLESPEVKQMLRCEFGSEIFRQDSTVDRKKLGAVVFSDAGKLSSLNAIVHPFIIEKALSMCESSGKDICILDGSELESSGVYKKCAVIIVITADDAVRLERIVTRDGISKEEAMNRMNAQKEFSKDAVFIENNGDVSSLEEKITALYNEFTEKADAQ